MHKEFLAHTTEERTQTLAEHLGQTATLASGFADAFLCGEFARAVAAAHDLGKYSPAFQDRIRGENRRVDHSSAGAQYLYNENRNALGLVGAYCIAGHHAGLPNGGSKSQPLAEPSALYARLSRQIPDYSAHKNDIQLPALEMPGVPVKDGFGLAFLTRMVYSCLVDADFLDTERFMKGAARQPIEESMQALLDKFCGYIEPFGQPTEPINIRRTELLTACIKKAAAVPGLFTLTAPTGSGKTLSSMAFALHHAVRHGHKRIIFVVPYNTIIEQNAAVYERIFGTECVLQHHSGVNYSNDENAPDYPKLLATENWDAPIVITSSVQFFESLFANRSSACRKLHNIAGSVIVFDEAQMLPPPYLIPCVQAIRELVQHYRCSAVLATATQSSLDGYFSPLKAVEIAPRPKALYEAFRRVSYKILDEPFTMEGLAAQLKQHEQTLCVVNTRKAAQQLATLAGATHLSTTMYPAHRSRVLADIRARLKSGETCRVVSTSMIEAGVDVDFPSVYRQKAGLDSILQTGGRCNREGKRHKAESLVSVFELEGVTNRTIALNVAAYEHAAAKYGDIAELGAIKEYFNQLFYIKGDAALGKEIVQAFHNGMQNACSFPFKAVAETFRLIPDVTRTVYVLHECPQLEQRLRYGERSRALFRELQKYTVSMYENDLRALGCFEALDEDVLLYCGEYDENIGIDLAPQSGKAYII